MRNDKFFAVVDESGLCGLLHDNYPSLKAVFANKEDAEEVTSKHKNLNLNVVEVELHISE